MGMPQVRGDLDIIDVHDGEPWILQLKTDYLRQFLADRF
jgi:hypothetical protein